MTQQGIKKEPILKIIAVIVAFVLIFVFFTTNMVSHANDAQRVYVSDVRIFYGNNFEEAKKLCSDSGYIPVDSDLNLGTADGLNSNVVNHIYTKYETADEDIRRELTDLYGGLGNSVCLGYKTTLNRDLAITDMSMLQMGLGYRNYNYSDYLKAQENRYRYLVQTILSIREEFKANLAKNSPAAKVALRTLNYYYYDEKDMLLGDYILSDVCTEDDFTALLSRCNATVMSTVFSAFVPAVADYNPGTVYVEGNYSVDVKIAKPMPSADIADDDTDGESADESTSSDNISEDESASDENDDDMTAGIPDNGSSVLKCGMDYGTWADRVSKTGMIEKYENGLIAKNEEKLYGSSADLIVAKLQEFAKDYHNAAARYNTYGNSALEGVGAMDEMTDIPGKLADDIVDDKVNDTSADAYYIGIYEMLNKYEFTKGKTLAEYIVDLGDRDYPDAASKHAVYPLVAAMTYGQLQMLSLNGIGTLTTYLSNTESLIDNADEYLGTLNDMISELKGKDESRLSVWEGVDKTIFDSQIAVTRTKLYSQDARDVSDEQKKPFGVMTFLSKTQQYLNFTTTVLGGVNGLLALGSMAINATLTNHFTVAACAAFAKSGGVLAAILGTTGKCMILLSGWLGLATIVMAIVVWAFDLICSHFEKDSIEYTSIPKFIADANNSVTICYNAVEGSNNKPADLLVGLGKKSSKGDWYFDNIFEWGYRFDQRPRWNALFVTRDPDAGSPLCLDSTGNCFIVQKNDLAAPQTYVPMNAFNEFAAANLNSFAANESAPALYLFYHTEDSLAEINKGTASDEGSFLNSIYFSTGETETIAKSELIRQGYNIIDTNLTPDVDKVYTYMGFTTQKVADSAITDIRVAPKTLGSLSFGNAGYTQLGDNPSKPTLQNEDSVYYSSYKCVGDALTTDFQIVNDIKDAKEGYLPITTFSGIPYNFNHNHDQSYLSSVVDYGYALFHDDLDEALSRINKPVYVFYRPSVTYSDKKDENGIEPVKYLAGISNFVIVPDSRWDRSVCEEYIRHYADQVGAQLFENKLLDGIQFERTGEEYVFRKNPGPALSYFLVTTTLDPKKAVTDIRSYTSAPSCTTLPTVQGSKEIGGYAAADVMLATTYFKASDRMQISSLEYADSHDYMNFIAALPSGSFDNDNDGLKMLPEDFETEGYYSEAPYSKVYKNYKNISERNTYLRCKNIYLEGPCEGKNPLTLDDIIFTNETLSDMSDAPETLSGNTAAKEEYVSVQDARTPHAVKDHNLGFRDVDGGNKAQYIYIRRYKTVTAVDEETGTEKETKTLVKPTEDMYISNVMVASFNADDQENAKADLRNAYDNCISTLLSGCTDEILPYTLTELSLANRSVMDSLVNSSISLDELSINIFYDVFARRETAGAEAPLSYVSGNWQLYEKADGKAEHLAYLGVSRTGDASNAVTGLLKYMPADGNKPADVIIVGGIKYTSCGGRIHDVTGKDYYLFQTTQSAAGAPMTAVDFGVLPYMNGAATAPYTSTQGDSDNKTHIVSNEDRATNFIYCYYNDNSEYIDAIYIGHGETIFEACSDLLSSGCKYAVLYDVRRNAKEGDNYAAVTDYVFIGYTTYRTTYDKRGKIASQMGVRDIVFVKPDDPDNVKTEITLDKKKYIAARDSSGKPYPINSADNTYIYYRAVTDTSKKAVPLINRLGIAERDRVPAENQGWENVLTTDNERYNLNENRVVYGKDDLAIDSRAYLFCKRVPNTDNYVKPGAAIVGGHCEECVTYGPLYLQK